MNTAILWVHVRSSSFKLQRWNDERKWKTNRFKHRGELLCVCTAAAQADICNDLCVHCVYTWVCVRLLLSFLVTGSSRHCCYVIFAVKHIHTHLCSCRHTRTVYPHAYTVVQAFFFLFRKAIEVIILSQWEKSAWYLSSIKKAQFLPAGK